MGNGTITGKDANITIQSKTHSNYGISDFSITLDKGTVEQSLLGKKGNKFHEGALSIEGSLTCCKFGASGSDDMLNSIVDGTIITVSGSTDDSAQIGWYFHSCQVTGYDISMGDATTITEASIDFMVMDPQNATYSQGWITGA